MDEFFFEELCKLGCCAVGGDEEVAVKHFFGRVYDFFLVESAAILLKNLLKYFVVLRGSSSNLFFLGFDLIPNCLRFNQGACLTRNTSWSQALNDDMHTDVKLFLQAIEDILDAVLYLQVKARVTFLDALEHTAFFYLAKKQISIHRYFVPFELFQIFFVSRVLLLCKTYKIGPKNLRAYRGILIQIVASLK